MSLTFTLDNDSLCKILNNSQLCLELTSLLRKHEARIYIPSQVLIECFSGSSETSVLMRRERLLSIYQQTGQAKVRFCRTTHEIIKTEKGKLGRISNIPVVSKERVMQTYLASEKEFKHLIPELRDQDKLYKARRKERKQSDLKFRQGAIEMRFSQENLRQHLINYDPSTVQQKFFWFFSKDLGSYLSKPQWRKAIRRKRPSFISAVTHILAFNYVAAACSHPDPSIKKWRELDENNWVDVFVAGSAAYSDYFVTEDSRLAAVCRQLHLMKAVYFQTIDCNSVFKILQT